MTRFILLAAAISGALSLAALSASAQQLGGTPTHVLNPSESPSSQPTSPVQQQIQEDYRSSLLSAKRDLL